MDGLSLIQSANWTLAGKRGILDDPPLVTEKGKHTANSYLVIIKGPFVICCV